MSDISTIKVNSVNYTLKDSTARSGLDGKLDDYTILFPVSQSGNPWPAKFLTVNYTTCDVNGGVLIKLGAVSGHGNGTSYTFLEDIFISVDYVGTISCNNYKYYAADTTYDGLSMHFGDIFWVHDSTNKIVDFYFLSGQYTTSKFMPYKRLNTSTVGVITQYTTATKYSSGTKVWANNTFYSVKSDFDAYRTASAQDVIDGGKQATLVSGTNIKTINSTSLLGSGNISIPTGFNPTLLWTNSAPTSSFAAQTITISSLSSYNYIYMFYDDRYVRYATMIMKNENGLRYMLCTTDVINYVASVAVRTVTLESTGIKFGNGAVKHHNSSSTGQDNTFLIPVRIYGFN